MSKALKLKDDLNLRQKRFVKYYLQTGNPSKAVILAGYEVGKKNPNQTKAQRLSVIASMANELMTNPKVKRALDKAYVKENITPESVLKRIDQIADSDEATRDRLKALELLGKNQRLFSDTESKDTNVNIVLAFGSDNKPEVIDTQ